MQICLSGPAIFRPYLQSHTCLTVECQSNETPICRSKCSSCSTILAPCVKTKLFGGVYIPALVSTWPRYTTMVLFRAPSPV
ncbi:hypothetical protein BDV25DRAFT_147256 [Aspergillus avenaceus]|uniref:Uncharacterized protein n=1 Tax=Aspergillus avenaceus TaxID=36643 RepID=A0A5N6U978_ASPAV|nr:hypothetical protein BDV25DRAFT_147256 [Aspergillus avenaceus]